MATFLYVLIFIVFLFFFPYMLRYFDQWRLSEKCRKNGYIILSFDDGPGTIVTSQLLKLFDENNIKASFFMLGSKVEGNGAIIKRMHSLGHDIGTHGYAHLNAWKTNPIIAIKDIARCIKILSDVGIESFLFRPPHGKINIFTWIYLLYRKQKLCWWSDDSGDTFVQVPSPISFANKVINKGGGVVLMHDHHKSEERVKYIIKATEKMIELAKINGLEFKTFREVL